VKRCELRIFVFLFLGAIVNVAVAWEVMLTADVRAVQMQATREHVPSRPRLSALAWRHGIMPRWTGRTGANSLGRLCFF